MTNFDPSHCYLPVNDDAMRWGIYVTGIGRATTPPGSPYPKLSHPRLYHFLWAQGRVLPEFAVLFFNDGRGTFESEITGPVVVPPDSVLFLFPGVWNRYRPLCELGWTERWLCFNGELAHRLMEMSLLQRDVPVRQIADPLSFAASFDSLFERIIADPAGNSILLSLDVLGLLGSALRTSVGIELPSALESSRKARATSDTLVSAALSLIWTRGHQAISVEDIADAIGISRRTLEQRFQRSLGHPIVEEIINCRTNRARRLLEETELPVKAIAYLAGFPSQDRMRVAFAQREHCSPLQFRRRVRQADLDYRR